MGSQNREEQDDAVPVLDFTDEHISVLLAEFSKLDPDGTGRVAVSAMRGFLCELFSDITQLDPQHQVVVTCAEHSLNELLQSIHRATQSTDITFPETLQWLRTAVPQFIFFAGLLMQSEEQQQRQSST
eukprot:ANDGO_04774.mRNA.1 hypothetical protein